MKLISLNVEIDKHYDTVWPFLDAESPDILCLQEASDDYIAGLKERGYHVTALEHVKKIAQEGHEITDHDLIATKLPHEAHTWYYFNPGGELEVENESDRRLTNRQGLVEVTFTDESGEVYTVLTTHFTLGPDGATMSPEQKADMDKLLAHADTLPPHIFCGDLNFSREHHPFFPVLTERYVDNIPEHYASSMDRNLHKHGSNPEKSFIFDSFMVDYLFTQPPYKASDVRLEFGISDHAAVIANIHKK